MLPWLWTSLPDALLHVSLIVLVRALPFAVFVVAGRRARAGVRAAIAVSYAGLLVVAGSSNRTLWVIFALGTLYYVACVCALHWATRGGAALVGAMRAPLFFVLALLFLVVPAVLLPVSIAQVFLFIGWELLLKGYSYAVEPSARAAGVRDALFFFLVDPTLVYTQRARALPAAPPRLPAIRRLVLGMLVVLLPALLARGLLQALDAQMQRAGVPALLLGLLVYGCIQFAAEYAKHSGVASMQIAWMRLCGYRLAERYDRPWLARSPADFWARWNIYVGQWLKRYLHYPLTRRLACARGHTVRALGPALSVVLVFGAMGAMHDGFSYLLSFEPSLSWSGFFAGNALLMVSWSSFARRSAPAPASGSPTRLQWGRAAFQLLFLLLVGVWG